MREKGKKYWDAWNLVDIAVFISFIYYFNASQNLEAELKKVYPNNAKIGNNNVEASVIPGRDAEDVALPPDDLLFWCRMNSFILIFNALKLMNLVRVHEEFGKMVTLVKQVLLDAKTFTLFFATWVILFSLLFQINGIIIESPNPEDVTYEWDVQDFDYPELSTMVMNCI